MYTYYDMKITSNMIACFRDFRPPNDHKRKLHAIMENCWWNIYVVSLRKTAAWPVYTLNDLLRNKLNYANWKIHLELPFSSTKVKLLTRNGIHSILWSNLSTKRKKKRARAMKNIFFKFRTCLENKLWGLLHSLRYCSRLCLFYEAGIAVSFTFSSSRLRVEGFPERCGPVEASYAGHFYKLIWTFNFV